MIAERTTQDYTFAYDVGSKDTLALTGVAQLIWTPYRQGTPIARIIDALSQRFPGVPRATLGADTAEFLQELQHRLEAPAGPPRHDASQALDPSGYALISAEYEKSGLCLHAQLEVTSRCNCNCRHCYLAAKPEEWSLESFRGLLGQLKARGTLFLNVTGGEVFLLRDIWKMIESAITEGFALSILTNGTLLDTDSCRRLSQLPLDYVDISIYGITAQTHDTITQVPGSFRRTVRAIDDLLGRGVNAWTRYVLMKPNLGEFSQFRQDWPRANRPFDTAYLLQRNFAGRPGPETLRADNVDIASLIESKSLLPLPCSNCTAGRIKCRISSDGTLYPCELLPISAGNVREAGFPGLWDQLRKWPVPQVPECHVCALAEGCLRCPGFHYVENGAFRPARFICHLRQCLNLMRLNHEK